jgi:hypothetical protein
VEDFAEDASPQAVVDVLQRLSQEPDARSMAVLRSFLASRHAATMLKPLPSQLAVRSLLRLGAAGIDVLRDALLDGDGGRVRYAASVLAALWHASEGRGAVNVMLYRTGDDLLVGELPDGTREAADRAVRDIFAEALVDPDAFSLVCRFANETALRSDLLPATAGGDVHPGEVMALFSEASIKLSRSVLDEFRRLIEADEREETYQHFLAQNPVILDPLAAEVVPKQRLGGELATDFAVRRHDDRWILVEIERPQDLLFTNSHDFRERFVHAFGQVLDFQSWVDNNVAYAQTLMPKISAPRGMLVMGRRAALVDRQETKLRRFADNSHRIEIHTFDDLLRRAASLYENLHHRS